MYQFIYCFLSVIMLVIIAYYFKKYHCLLVCKGEKKAKEISRGISDSPIYKSCSAPCVTNCILRRATSINHGDKRGKESVKWSHLRHGNSNCNAKVQYYTTTCVAQRNSTPKRLSAIPKPLITTPPSHQSTTPLHIMSYERREKVKEFSSRLSISVTATGNAVHFLSSTSFFVALQVLNKVNYGVVLLLGVVSLMAGSTTAVPISPGYGGYQQQHTQQPLTTLKVASATPLRINLLPHGSAQVLHYNLRRSSLHHEGSGVLHHEGSRVLHHEGSRVLHHEGSRVLHHEGSEVLHQGSSLLHYNPRCSRVLH
ncbi:uncharacterized protein LOC124313229 [Daphnia pulicaria]|uniref:uncharacterized protein LOC124313229 n=1 Tax=Daphnia pulicaria TaxID=35523 RepID=UPI001EEAD386|nr:uncharacterized protein LOC124313229 [Daphnia pulicaria]